MQIQCLCLGMREKGTIARAVFCDASQTLRGVQWELRFVLKARSVGTAPWGVQNDEISIKNAMVRWRSHACAMHVISAIESATILDKAGTQEMSKEGHG